ncbi:choline/ethanolamine kinase family protein [Sulfurospirillum arcachonense]|uniref:choline/ethanolamine kinase family protein n=1 Tax=Sulfurospirillum arcachonense TaxID=57666 RepID=UPI0004ADDADD|nr:choline/ethanolamine kinase family protein [Sulfurospirillum arcachonense]
MINIKLLKKYKIFKNEKLQKLTLLKNQGFNNTNYLLKTSKQNYIVRVFNSNENVPLSRKFEFKISKKAHKKDIGAKPILLDEKNSLMIYEFLKGRHKYKLNKNDIKNIALVLKKFHTIKTNKKAFDLRKALHKSLSSKTNKALKNLKKFKKEYVLCHHDLNPKNFIFSDTMKLIDFEYARKNDLYFDLASVVIEFKLNKREENFFLKSYFNSPFKKNKKKLDSFKIIYKELCRLWFEKRS